jgi:hypothetical protein
LGHEASNCFCASSADDALLFQEYFPYHHLVIEMSKSMKSKPSGAEKGNANKLGLFTMMDRSTVSASGG